MIALSLEGLSGARRGSYRGRAVPHKQLPIGGPQVEVRGYRVRRVWVCGCGG